MKIISWNVNSIRAREPLVEKLIQKENPDILCLQELKTEDKNIIEDLIIVATNNAKKAVEIITQEEMSKLTGGMKLPAGLKFPF